MYEESVQERSEFLYDKMKRVKQLIGECGQESLLKEWQRAYTRLNESKFTITVVGEFSRGKSTLINQLMEKELLPVGILATTTSITKIAYGPEAALWWVYPDGKGDRIPLTQEAWENSSELSEGAGARKRAYVEIPNEWLKETGVYIVDTPGAGDLESEAMSQVLEMISESDAALVVVNASMALSLTEKCFIEQNIISRKIPRVAVVMTHLDQITQKEREAVVKYTRSKLNEWAPGVELYCSHTMEELGVDGLLLEVSGSQKILNTLSKWAWDPEHLQLRDIQIRTQLQEILKFLYSGTTARKQSTILSVEQKSQLIKDAQQNIERRQLNWEDFRLELESKENGTKLLLQKNLNIKKGELLEKLKYELYHSPNPKTWWERDLPYRLRQEATFITRMLEDAVQKKTVQDALWVENQAKKIFSWVMTFEKNPQNVEIENIDMEHEIDIKDLERVRLFARIGLASTTILGYFIFGSLGTAISLGGGIVSEKAFGDSINKQKQQLEKSIDDLLNKVFSEAVVLMEDKLHNTYSTMLNYIRKQEKQWTLLQQQAIKAEGGGTPINIGKFDDLIDEISTLMKQLD